VASGRQDADLGDLLRADGLDRGIWNSENPDRYDLIGECLVEVSAGEFDQLGESPCREIDLVDERRRPGPNRAALRVGLVPVGLVKNGTSFGGSSGSSASPTDVFIAEIPSPSLGRGSGVRHHRSAGTSTVDPSPLGAASVGQPGAASPGVPGHLRLGFFNEQNPESVPLA
jgi:hypothetical protein